MISLSRRQVATTAHVDISTTALTGTSSGEHSKACQSKSSLREITSADAENGRMADHGSSVTCQHHLPNVGGLETARLR